jgi:hypothetical protein
VEDLGKLFARLHSRGVAAPDELEGCTPTELLELERRLDVQLPATYRAFLARMGHGSGRLFTHDHVETSYDDVVGWTEQLRAHPKLQLGKEAVVILARLGEQFEFINCSGETDPIVWYVADGEPREVLKSHGP